MNDTKNINLNDKSLEQENSVSTVKSEVDAEISNDSQIQILDDDKDCLSNSQKSRGKRLSDKEKENLLKKIWDDLLDGHPLQAIAIKHHITITLINKFFATLIMNDSDHKILPPKYEVLPAGTQMSKVTMLELNEAKFVRIERHENGIYIQPYSAENSDF